MSMENERFSELVTDSPSIAMLVKAKEECVETCYDRRETQKNQCGFGKNGVCCKFCHMGPCRITPKAPRGICGADADTMVARNYVRAVAGGASAHSDHGRHLALILRDVAMGKGGDFQIKDEKALLYWAKEYGIETDGREKNDIALDLADIFLGEFTLQEGALSGTRLAPKKRVAIWENTGVTPFGIDRMVVESMHRTTMGVDHDYKHLLMHAFQCGLGDGWGGSFVATISSDILFGTPKPLRSEANIGVLKEGNVNIIVHGHEPQLSEMLTIAIKTPEILELAKEAGAEGITLGGICCTANEVLMRHGIPPVGNFLQQELSIVSGAVEAMVVDVQCLMPSLPNVASHYHTEIITTSPIAKMIGAIHMPIDHHAPLDSAKAIVKRAIENFKKRDKSKVNIPAGKEPIIAGFSIDAIKYMLGGTYRASFRPLNDAIIANRIVGVVGIVGCNNPRKKTDEYNNIMVKELIKRNVLVVHTGCSALASGKAGYLKPEIALEHAGAGLKEVCETVGIPPVLHMGSCVDNCRILEAICEVIKEGGLGDDMSMVPAVGVAPEWMHEKAMAIGNYFVASGVDVVLGDGFDITGSENVSKFLYDECKEYFGASYHLHEDPMEGVEKIMKILNERRDKLNINKKAERKLLDMKDRREM